MFCRNCVSPVKSLLNFIGIKSLGYTLLPYPPPRHSCLPVLYFPRILRLGQNPDFLGQQLYTNLLRAQGCLKQKTISLQGRWFFQSITLSVIDSCCLLRIVRLLLNVYMRVGHPSGLTADGTLEIEQHPIQRGMRGGGGGMLGIV